MMPVSSERTSHRIQIDRISRGDYEHLKAVWDTPQTSLSHSRSPACLVGADNERSIHLFKIIDGNDELVAYFPFEEKSFFGIRIIQPAYFELTLDFIDLSVIPEWRECAPEIFLGWIKSLRNSATFLFMCSEESLIVQQAKRDPEFLVEQRGKYYHLDVPDSFDTFLNGLGRTSRHDTRRLLRAFDDTMSFEVVEGHIFGDELQQIIDDFFRLHLLVFPKNSAMLPHKSELVRYIEKGISDGVVVFTRAREISTGEVVAVNLLARSHGALGLIQNGRRVESKYNKIGSWLLIRTIQWSVESGVQRFEFLFGDQEYKRRLSTDVLDADSITHFSSRRARLFFRIRQRLGRRFASLR